MIVGFHFFVCFFLIIFQTTVLVNIPINTYDLMTPFVVYLAIYQRARKALPVMLFGGLLMDGLSGGIFGMYLSIYLWMYVGGRWVIQFLHVGNVILLPLLVIVGILFECLVSAFCAVALTSSFWPAKFVFSILTGQMAWGILTGPILVFVFAYGQKCVERTKNNIFSSDDGLRNS